MAALSTMLSRDTSGRRPHADQLSGNVAGGDKDPARSLPAEARSLVIHLGRHGQLLRMLLMLISIIRLVPRPCPHTTRIFMFSVGRRAPLNNAPGCARCRLLLVAAMMAPRLIHEQLGQPGDGIPRGVAVAGGQGDQQPHRVVALGAEADPPSARSAPVPNPADAVFRAGGHGWPGPVPARSRPSSSWER